MENLLFLGVLILKHIRVIHIFNIPIFFCNVICYYGLSCAEGSEDKGVSRNCKG